MPGVIPEKVNPEQQRAITHGRGGHCYFWQAQVRGNYGYCYHFSDVGKASTIIEGVTGLKVHTVFVSLVDGWVSFETWT